MKNYFNLRKKSKLLLLMLLAVFVGGVSPTWADELTIADGTQTSTQVPFDGYNADAAQHNQMIYPASYLENVVGKEITEFVFYFNSSYGTYSSDVETGRLGTWTISLGETESTTLSSLDNTTTLTQVYDGIMSWNHTERTLTITFDNSYIYNGGNLLVDFNHAAAKYNNYNFLGITASGAAYSRGAVKNFLPKLTLSYETPSAFPKPKGLKATDISTTSATLSWTEKGDATAWQISYNTVSGDPDNGTIVDAGTNPFTLTGLTAETIYYISVRSVSGGNSNWSDEIQIKPTAAQELTINEGSSTTNYLPFYYYGISSNNANGQFIVPSTDLASLENREITKLTFYASQTSVSWGSAQFRIYLKEVENTTFNSSTFESWDNLEQVYEGALSIDNGKMEIIFDDAFPYEGGNLLVGINQIQSGTNSTASWYYKSGSGNTGVYRGYSSNSTTTSRPKLTITSMPFTPSPKMEVSTTAIDFGTVTPEFTSEQKKRTFSISNKKGKADLSGLSVTLKDGSDSEFTLSEGIATSIVQGGDDIEVTVTFNPSSIKDYTGTIVVSATGQNDIEITLTGSYAANPAAMAITLGEEVVGETVAFGNVGKQATKTFNVTNTGNLKLNITSIASNNTTDFTVSPATLEVAGGSSETFTVTFLYDENALNVEKTANITITASNEGVDPVTFAVTGTRIEQWSEDFSGNVLPDGWETTNTTYWTFADGVAKGRYYSSPYYLITPSLKVESTTDVLTFDYVATGNYVTINVQKSKNGGDWETCTLTPAVSGINTGASGSTSITELEPGNYKFRFKADDYNLDNFQGFKRNLNDPKMGIYSDEECTAAVATSVTKDFGFATETQTATYYIKNDGTGTMTLSLGDAPEGITQALDKTSVIAGDKATLTITMPAENKGYNNGNIVVTATDLGTFTVAASGVIVDENKLYLDFATANIPSTWTTGDWTKSNYGYIENSNYSSSSIETSDLIATAGEEIIIEADMYTTSYTLGVNYRKAGDQEWSTLIAASNIGTSWTKLRATIEEAGTYQLQFVGTRTQIRRIYGLTMPMEPVMAVYDGENLTGTSFNFGSVTNDADAVKVFTVKNEGLAELTGLIATLSGDQAAHYTVEASATSIAAGSSATVTVKQLKDNLGTHSATLTISATDLDDKVITLSGMTRDASKLYEDFENGVPENWTASGWSRSSANGNYFMQSAYSGTNTLTLPIINVAANEQLSVDLSKQYNSTTPLTMRYTTDGGVTWTESNLSSDLTYGNFTTKTLSFGNTEAATAQIQFVGSYYARIDNFYGGSVTTAPIISLTEGGSAVENGSTKNFGTLTSEAGTATYILSNTGTADMVSTIAVAGDVTFEVTAMGEGVTKSENTLTIPAGKTATIVVTMAYAAPYAAKSGAMTITTEGWVGDFTINYTGATVDPTALYEDFAGNAKPEGWYNSSWSFSSGYASCLSSGSLITQRLTVEGTEDVLSYDVAKSSSWASSSKITVSYSTDRQNWIEASSNALSSTDYTTFNISGLEAGEYYLKFDGVYAKIDNIIGWHKVTGIDHDLYVSASSIPATTKVPEAEITATATVYSLRAAEEGVYAKLFFDETEVATADPKNIAKDGSASFTLTGNVPATEKTYAAKIVVYYSDNSVAFETLTTNVEVAHTRTLAVTAFARVGEGTMEANSSNQISPVFTVTVQNNGTTNYVNPTVKVFNDEVEVGTATSDATVEPGESTELTVTATNMSAGEGGELSFIAKAYWNATEFSYATPVVIEVTAAAPKFELAEKGGEAVENGAAVSFGLVREATTKSYTITNTGTKALELVSIVAPEGYEATALTDENKTIAINGTLDIDITLKALQGKKTGNLVFTYKVDDLTNKTFTLNLDGQSIAEDTWVETFDTAISADWSGDIGNSDWQWNSTYKAAYSSGYNYSHKLISPRLAANAGEELTFDVNFAYDGYNLKAEYSTDKTTWTEIGTYEYADRGTKIFIAPADGNYYLRFTGYRYALLDNLIGFRLNQPEHEIEIVSNNIPTTGTQYADYTATVRLKEILSKAEEVTAKLYVDGEAVAETTETIASKTTTTVSINWIPQEIITTEVEAYIEVTYAGGTLTTTPVSLTIDAPYELDEEDGTVVAGTYPALLLNRTFALGWNTICLPFSVATEDVKTLFGEDAAIYNFTGYADGNLNFTKTTSLSGGYPYIIYVKEAISEPIVVRNVTISNLNTTASYNQFSGAYFRGTYAPIAAPGMQGKYGVTNEAKIAKGSDKASMKGFRAYFELPNGASARLAFTDEDGTTTIINAIELDKQDGEVYNLNGQRVEGMKKGLYIINGKKVVRK